MGSGSLSKKSLQYTGSRPETRKLKREPLALLKSGSDSVAAWLCCNLAGRVGPRSPRRGWGGGSFLTDAMVLGAVLSGLPWRKCKYFTKIPKFELEGRGPSFHSVAVCFI